jgi:hypothetical protein
MARYELIYRKRRRWPWLLLAWIAFLIGGYMAANHITTAPAPPPLGQHQ